MRHKFPREFYIPKNSAKVADKLSDAVAYVYTVQKSNGTTRAAAAMFFGEQAKPVWHHIFMSEASREKHVAESFASRRASLAFKAEQKAKRKASGRGLAVGDVLRSSWGYDQTNIDYYQVTALIGETMVEVRPIGQHIEETGWCVGKCAPTPGEYTGEPMRCVAKDGSVKVRDWGVWARKVEPMKVIGGAPIYSASSWSAYH
jgi:hypothetical protein